MSPRERTPPHAVAQQASDPLRAMIDRASQAMVLLASDATILAANARAEALLDSPTALLFGRRFTEFFHERAQPILQRRLEACAEGEAPDDLEAVLQASGEAGLVCLTFLPAPGERVAILARDLTRERADRDAANRDEMAEYRRATAASKADSLGYTRAAAQNQKMIDLGRLIAGVTHEMRTPITYVTNNLALLQTELRELRAEQPDVAPRVDLALRLSGNALDGVERLQRLLAELRPLAKNKPHRTVLVNLAELVLDAVKVFEATKPGSTRIELDLQSTHQVPVDRDEMLNVLANLLNNASQAMGNGGTIRIKTRNRDAPPEIRVSDDGPGVAPEARRHLFEPFATTKADGTGLGLFISRRTVEAHGGTLVYEDEPGAGATFVIRLPAPPSS